MKLLFKSFERTQNASFNNLNVKNATESKRFYSQKKLKLVIALF